MARGSSKPEAVAVLDVGKTNVKLLAIAPDGTILSSRSAPNAVRRGEPYPHCDTEHIWRWMMAALADLGEAFAIAAIVPTGYGSTAALVAATPWCCRSWTTRPSRQETSPRPMPTSRLVRGMLLPDHPAGLTLARQLFWQSRAFPDDFRRARWILPFAQYWSWGLCGVPASEVTSLGAQPSSGTRASATCSTLGQARGLGRAAAAAALRLRRARARCSSKSPTKCGLPQEIPVLCGIHDSNADYARYLAAGLDDFTLISTGTWLITFNTACRWRASIPCAIPSPTPTFWAGRSRARASWADASMR